MSQLFVVERYDDSGAPGGRPEPFPPPPADVVVFYAVVVPADDVVMALVERADESADEGAVDSAVEGADGETVRSSLAAAGWQIDRITPATWAHPRKDIP